MASVSDLKNAEPGSVALFDIRKKPDDRQIPGSKAYDGETLTEDPPFDRSARVVLYCGSGNSCSRIARELQERGYRNVEALEGGYAAWVDAGLPLEPKTPGE